jgi:hypothetical protein
VYPVLGVASVNQSAISALSTSPALGRCGALDQLPSVGLLLASLLYTLPPNFARRRRLTQTETAAWIPCPRGIPTTAHNSLARLIISV